ncbi:hypothetical protein EDC96DRAFT_532022 [Choanephora cucurbitarum]|nr:hypothetical protein EDC96DRAFT_532022 [Choanephora cucurbitarum]
MLKSILISVALSILCVSAAPAPSVPCDEEHAYKSCQYLDKLQSGHYVELKYLCNLDDLLNPNQQVTSTYEYKNEVVVYNSLCEAAIGIQDVLEKDLRPLPQM